MTKAVLFDMDGVLIKTEWETFKFYQDYLAQHHNISLSDDDFKHKAGRKSADFWNAVLTTQQRTGIDVAAITALKREKFNQNPERYIEKVPGTQELLQEIKKNNLPMALASQNELRMIQTVTDWMNIRNYFDTLLSIEDINKLKPDPEIYLLAAQRLKVLPRECVVIEDSQDGVNAAKNAGMRCIGIRHNYTPADALQRADVVVNALNEISIEMLLA